MTSIYIGIQLHLCSENTLAISEIFLFESLQKQTNLVLFQSWGEKLLLSLLYVRAFSLNVFISVRPQWDVQIFDDTHGVRKVSNLQQRLFSLRALVTSCVPCFSVPCLIYGSYGANELSGICMECLRKKKKRPIGEDDQGRENVLSRCQRTAS